MQRAVRGALVKKPISFFLVRVIASFGNWYWSGPHQDLIAILQSEQLKGDLIKGPFTRTFQGTVKLHPWLRHGGTNVISVPKDTGRASRTKAGVTQRVPLGEEP